MTNNADLIARLRRSPADTSQEFDAFVASYTGRDTAYHERNQTTGLAFARACWDAALGRPPLPPGAGRTARVEWRTTPATKTRAQELADAAGLPLSAWLDGLVERARK